MSKLQLGDVVKVRRGNTDGVGITWTVTRLTDNRKISARQVFLKEVTFQVRNNDAFAIGTLVKKVTAVEPIKFSRREKIFVGQQGRVTSLKEAFLNHKGMWGNE